MNVLVPGQFDVGMEPPAVPSGEATDVVVLVRPGTVVTVERSETAPLESVRVVAHPGQEVLVGEIAPADRKKRRLRRA